MIAILFDLLAGAVLALALLAFWWFAGDLLDRASFPTLAPVYARPSS